LVRFKAENEQVPGQVLRTFLQSVERTGHEALPLLRHVSVDPRTLTSLSARVKWDDLATVIDRFVLDRGQPTMNRVARDMVLGLPGLRLLSGLLLPPRVFFRTVFDVAGRAGLWAVHYEEAGASAVASLELHKAMRGCAAAFEAMGEMLAAAPRLLNLPDTHVEGHAHSHGGRYEFELPRGRALQTRVSEQQVAGLVEEFVAASPWARSSREGSLPTVAQLEARFGLTRAEGRVVRRLVAGRSLTQIAVELEVGVETVRTHAKRAMQKTDTHRQAELVALVLRMGARGDT
jgi:DNA-binding CsgD family transcriptional regulator